MSDIKTHPYKLVSQYDPILRNKCESFDFGNPPVDPEELTKRLKITMVNSKGIGLSAPQVGLPYRVFVVGDPTSKSLDEIKVMFNPKIVDSSEQDVLYEEGCLSFPGLFIKVKRPYSIRVRYANEKGEVKTEVYDEISARAILHEYDHLNGVLFMDVATKYHRDYGFNQKKKLDRLRKKNLKRKKELKAS